jgi:hypothetical protein
MEKEFSELPKAIQVIVNNTDSEVLRIRDRLETVLHKAEDIEDLRVKMAEILDDAVKELASLREDLKSPVILVDLPETHPCDGCEVIEGNLDPNDHCHGCNFEPTLQYYVPKYLRKGDDE